ncbi:hypothetical protein BGZ60DRAFT_510652 [Tricladium varicosporioides]|nr:hypothetical protein BGZ60DRAFT_510652 [Hymenoscyphus varicosporioides]
MFDDRIVCFSNSSTLPSLVGALLVVDGTDFPGIHIAIRNLANDFARVTKGDPNPIQILREQQKGVANNADTAIIRLEKNGKLDLGRIRGKWESYITVVVEQPFLGCRRALVIAGSDKRGAIFGIYSLSEQIGVSPWYWWADVVEQSHSEIYALPVITIQGEPSIRYRGIFINDEAPALTGWVLENFGKYGTEFYKKVFELLLRLKANFLWPAMWPGYPNPGATFFTDDPENQKTAEDYGICISTSHHEPMQRQSNEWFADNPDGSWNWLTNKQKITQFFDEGVRRANRFESYFTLGMRGEYDKKMVTDDPTSILKEVIQTQRAIIKEIHGQEDAVPQLLALYKEVQEHYESGRLEIPDDITLLFSDDNFGSIRRLPYGEETGRSGGAGIYYHLEYVGDPRSYKWTNSNSLAKTWHQLQEAYHRGARQIWIFNVGDIKPLETPLTFSMSLAWNINSIKADGLAQFFSAIALREFGPRLSTEIGAAWLEYDYLISLRRHEHIEPTTFSLLNYNEAEIILSRWKYLLNAAESIHHLSLESQHPSIFQLVLHPIKSSYIFTTLQITLARNQLFARQRRNSANTLFQTALSLFSADFELSEEYHALLHGKWNHIMSQAHYGFGDTWHAPSRDMISGLCYVQNRQNSNAVVGQMGIAVEGHEGVRPGRCNEESDRTHPSRRDLVPSVTLGAMTRYGPENRWFEIFTRGKPRIHWSASTPFSWIHLSSESGELAPGEDDARVEISVDWEQVPLDFEGEVLISISSQEGDFEQIHLPINGQKIPDSFMAGFIEGDGYICIPASSCDVKFPYRILPSTAVSSTDTDPTLWLTYDVFVFTNTPTASLILYFNMTLDVDPSNPMTYDIRIAGKEIQTYRLLPEPAKKGELPVGWWDAVQDCVWVRRHQLGEDFTPGKHSIEVRLRSSNLVLERIIVDLGGLMDSYLGPPPSHCLKKK